MGNKILTKIILFFRTNIFLAALIAITLGLSIFLKPPLEQFPAFVDWKTIVTLTGLLLITTAIRESGLFYLTAYRISHRIDDERFLALFMIFSALVLSTFLTNDIALFIIVPLTLSLQQISGNNYTKMIVFEAIAVNSGSSLTSIGNPQNIFLAHKFGISFPVFVIQMAPTVLVMVLCLLIFILIFFPSKKIKLINYQHPEVDKKLFFISVLLLILFILSIELKIEEYFLAVVFGCYLLFSRKAILKMDWGLIFLFIFLFIDLQLVCRLKIMQDLHAMLNLNNPNNLFLYTAFLSQGISNVPTSILLVNYSSNFKVIAYGVNIAGNGLIIGSFANLIAMRFIEDRSKYKMFHKYSLPYFLITLGFTYFLLI
ncbi:MAG: citrate transporter [Deltaproteobacteria bacterium]|nr:MAG: citrate transporter [Deltaproteobacteria bacterium]